MKAAGGSSFLLNVKEADNRLRQTCANTVSTVLVKFLAGESLLSDPLKDGIARARIRSTCKRKRDTNYLGNVANDNRQRCDTPHEGEEKTIMFEQTNPKRFPGASHQRYEAYKKATTVKEALDFGAKAADLEYDRRKGYLVEGNPQP